MFLGGDELNEQEDDEARRKNGYTTKQVETLLGLHEYVGSHGRVSCTIVDILSWAHDPGGMSLRRQDIPNWRSQRGPLAPDSLAACILYDFERAMKQLSIMEQAVVALKAFGFSESEIGALLGVKQQRVSSILRGRIIRDREGAPVLDPETDRPARRGGVVGKLSVAMSHGGAA